MIFYSHSRNTTDDDLEMQTVPEHCRASAEYAKKSLEPAHLGQAAYLAGLLHDMGKMKQEFQDYLLYNKGARGSVNHTFAGCRYLLSHFHSSQSFSCEYLSAELLAFAVGAHHGLFDCIDKDGRSGFLHRIDAQNTGYQESLDNFLAQCANTDELNRLFGAANSELTVVYEAISKLSGDNDEEFAFYQGLLARLLLSSVIEGDRRDTAEFMTKVMLPPVPDDYSEFWNKHLLHLEAKLNSFQKDTPIQQARAVFSQKCRDFGDASGGVIRLNVPTGGGKTLSSLRFALNHARKHRKRRLIFTSPLLTILEQNAAIIREYIGDDSIILEHHSNVADPVDTDELNIRELAVDSWSSPVIITTLVQLLNTLFDGRSTSIRRFQSLCDSVIVIDEVQTVPSKMLSLFNLAIGFLSNICGATVVLCSATQPCLTAVSHKILPEPDNMIPYDNKLWEAFRRTQITDAGSMSLEEAAGFIRGSMEQVKSLLVICNKKDQAVYLSDALKGAADTCCHLSAAMCPAHRRNTLTQLYEALDSEKSCLCIATQVIEAGVDISFQRVIRFTAGMDSVVQAAGRCNRNGKDALAPVYVITLLDENLNHLDEIRRGKHATVSLLSAYRNDPERFQFDLASDESIEYYYNRFYGAMPKGAQDYLLPREKISLLTLLSDNHKYYGDTDYGYMLNQAFRTAGSAFTVFDSDTQDVVVPYGEGKVLIEELAAQSNIDIVFLNEWISRARPYTISLYEYQARALNDVLAEYDGVRVLPPEYYNEQTGFTLKPGEFEFLEV